MNRASVRALLDVLLPAALASISVGAVLAEVPLVAFLAAGAALVAIVWRQGWSLAGRSGTFAPRLALAVAALALHAHMTEAPAPDWPLALAGMTLVGLLSVEGLLGRITRPLYEAVHLDGAHGNRRQLFTRSTASAANTLVVVVVLVAAVFAWSGWLPLAAALMATAVTAGAVLTAGRQRVTQKASVLEQLQRQVSDYQPRFMIYFSAPAGSLYQIMMWLPYLERIGERFIVVMRERHSFEAVAAATDAPVIYTPEMSTFDATVVPSLRAVFYVNNGYKNTHCVRYGELTHVFLNHGDSDKVSSFNPVTAMYDLVFVAGRAGIDRYLRHGVDLPERKFRVVGRPQVAEVERPERRVDEASEPVVLYAPTWVGHYSDANYSSLPISGDIVRALLAQGVTVILRHHPYTTRDRQSARQLREAHRLLAEDAERSGRRHLWGDAAARDLSLIDCFNRSDAMVTDVSSVASEYLYSEKPFAITDMTGEGDAFEESFPLARVAYVVRPDGANLADVLHRLLVADPLRAARQEARIHYLGDFPRESYVDVFVAEARRCLGGEPAEPTEASEALEASEPSEPTEATEPVRAAPEQQPAAWATP